MKLHKIFSLLSIVFAFHATADVALLTTEELKGEPTKVIRLFYIKNGELFKRGCYIKNLNVISIKDLSSDQIYNCYRAGVGPSIFRDNTEVKSSHFNNFYGGIKNVAAYLEKNRRDVLPPLSPDQTKALSLGTEFSKIKWRDQEHYLGSFGTYWFLKDELENVEKTIVEFPGNSYLINAKSELKWSIAAAKIILDGRFENILKESKKVLENEFENLKKDLGDDSKLIRYELTGGPKQAWEIQGDPKSVREILVEAIN